MERPKAMWIMCMFFTALSAQGKVDLRISNLKIFCFDRFRFFKLTGRLFGFVAKDLEWKISVIQKRVADKDCGCHYTTVNTMVQYELNNVPGLHKGQRFSGSRTLLRLHWALEFILEFMSRISQSTDHDKTSHIASEVYHQTLSNHHPWLTRKMAAIAMYFLPTRKDLISAMCKQDYHTVLELLGKVVQAGNETYQRVDRILAENKLLNIP